MSTKIAMLRCPECKAQRDALLAAAKVVAPYLVAIEHPSAQELLRAVAACETKEQATA